MDEGSDFSEVLRAAQGGNQEAIGVLYLRLSGRVLGYLRAHVGQDAEDVASEVWLSVARSLPRFAGGESDFRCWVFTIARRRVVDWLRAAPWYQVTALSDRSDDMVDPVTDTAGEVVERFAAQDTLARLADYLPEEQARVLILRVVAGLSTEEVARVVEKKEGAVRMLLHRAIKNLAPLAEELFEISSEDT